MDRRSVIRGIVSLAACGVAGCVGAGGNDGGYGSGGGATGTPPPTLGADPTLESPSFGDGASIPARFTCEGANVSPALEVSEVPSGASSLALLVDDPDAPGGTFTHWLLWDLPASTGTIPEGVPAGGTVASLGGAKQGTNDADVVGYSGPCPPREDGAHTYRFRLLALAEPLALDAGADRSAFDAALEAVARSEAVLRGEFDR